MPPDLCVAGPRPGSPRRARRRVGLPNRPKWRNFRWHSELRQLAANALGMAVTLKRGRHPTIGGSFTNCSASLCGGIGRNGSHSVNCRQAIALLDDSLDVEVGSRVGWGFKLHLWCCSNCRNYRASYRTTIWLEKIAFQHPSEQEPTVPEDLVAEILASIGDGTRIRKCSGTEHSE